MQFTKKRFCALSVLMVTFLFCLTFRILFETVVNAVIEMELSRRLPLKNGSMAFRYWVRPPVPVEFSIYVFDIVNPEEILASQAVPTVLERGPYTYRLHLEKRNIRYHRDNNTIQYRQLQRFVFHRPSSVGWDTETFTTVNIPFLTVANVLQYEPAWLQTIVDAYFRSQNETTFIRRSVRDIWWGYDDPVLQQASAIARRLNISSPLLTGQFGFYMNRNNTDDGVFNVFSGWNHNFEDYATIDRWNGMTHQSIWKSDQANRIVGSADGSMQPPRITKQSNLSLFDTNLKRTLKLEFNTSASYSGVDVLRFLVPYSEFASATDNPDNAGYCTPDTHHCPPSGAINMSAATYTAPLCASLPHFLGGDPFYQRQVRGLSPSQARHQPFYDYHAITGVALNAARRAFRKMADAYVPVLWIDGVAIMDEATLSLFRSQIQAPLDSLVYVKIALVAVACLAAVTAVVLLLLWGRKDRVQVKPNKDANDENSKLIKGIHHGSIQRSQWSRVSEVTEVYVPPDDDLLT